MHQYSVYGQLPRQGDQGEMRQALAKRTLLLQTAVWQCGLRCLAAY